MLRWQEFELSAPRLAQEGRKLITSFGLGLGYLATIRRDGAPRLHPFCPIFHEGGLYGLILPASPKCGDLRRDGRFAIHAFPLPDRDDEFYLSGRARPADELAAAVRATYLAQEGSPTSSGDEACFEFLLDRALLAEYPPRREGPAWPPVYTKWRAP